MSSEPETDSVSPPNVAHHHQPSAWSILLTIGLILSVIGIISFALPMVTAIAVELLVAASLLLTGCSLAFQAYRARLHTNVTADAICAAMFLLGGLAMLVFPTKGIAAISLVLAILFTLEGIARLIFAFRLPPYFNRALPIIEGIAGIVIGIFFWVNWPGDSAWMIGLLVGIRFLLAGLTFIMFAFTVRGLSHDA